MPKYCLLDCDLNDDIFDTIGIKQWIKVFNGDLAKIDGTDLRNYEIVHIRLTKNNFGIIERAKAMLMSHPSTKLILSVDLNVTECQELLKDISTLTGILNLADFIFATEHTIAEFFRPIYHKPIFEIPHPTDLDNALSHEESNKKNNQILVVSRNSDSKTKLFQLLGYPTFFRHLLLLFFSLLFRCRVKFIQYPTTKNSYHNFIKKISESRFTLSFPTTADYGKEILLTTTLKSISIGPYSLDAQRRCLPFTTYAHFKEAIKLFLWLRFNKEARQFVVENAISKIEYYNLQNSKYRLLKALYGQKPELSPTKNERICFSERITYLFGPKDITWSNTEFSVFCLEKNSMDLLPAYLRHYRNLGAKHFFFTDNCSTDETLEYLRSQPDVTVYSTDLKHWKYESEIRQFLVLTHGSGKWCLCTDMDEFFDYPLSHKIPMATILKYLNEKGFTSMVSNMIDMFALDPSKINQSIEESYKYYDLSHITSDAYFNGQMAFCNYNKLSIPEMKTLYGGIRQQFVQNKHSIFSLVKHPLLFIDQTIEPFTTPHYSNKTKVADITGILKHYKLTKKMTQKVKEGIASDTYSFMIKDEINANLQMENFQQSINKSTALIFENTEALVENGFITVSEDFLSFTANTYHTDHKPMFNKL